MAGLWRMMAVVGLACASMAAAAQVPVPAAAGEQKKVPGADVAHALDGPDVEAFFDGIIPLQLERSDIAGASVLVMQDGKVLLQKGYGYADVKSGKPVDPVSTIFRLASISKLFTWVSVMQLVEQGKLDLDADVNRYLDFSINQQFGKPVTLRHLMTHTAGFEEQVRDVILTDPKKAVSLRDFMMRNEPPQLHAPGTVSAYSNYGVGLAGYIVERVSGQPFEQYVATHIFTPLGMVHSTFAQPPPGALAALPSEGYRADTTKPKVGFEIFNPVPAGGISSTAADMGRFGEALLNGGTLDGAQVLRPETVQAMWTPQFRASDQLPAICMGFYELWRDNVHWIGHEGDLIAFHSLFFLEPQHRITLFVSYNSAGGGAKPRPEVIDMFTDRYFPGYTAPKPISETRDELKQIEGTYAPTRRADSTRLRLLGLSSQSIVTVDKDGIMHMGEAKDLRGHPVKFKPIAKDLWQNVDGQQRVFAIRDSSGRIVRIAGGFPGSQMERMPWYASVGFVGLVAFVSFAVLLLLVAAALWRLGRRIFLRRRGRPVPQPGTVWLPVMTKVAALAWVLPLVATFAYMAKAGENMTPPTDSWDRGFTIMSLVVGFAMLLSLFPIVSGLRVWGSTAVRAITKIKFTVVALSFLGMCWLAVFFHLIGTVRI